MKWDKEIILALIGLAGAVVSAVKEVAIASME